MTSPARSRPLALLVALSLTLVAAESAAQSDASVRDASADASVPDGQSPDASGPEAPRDPAAEARAAEARAAFERGISLTQQERWGEALPEFRRSVELVPRASSAFNVATTLVRLGRHVEAVSAFEQYLRIADPASEGARYVDARAQLDAERAAIATLVIELDPPDAELRLDGQRAQGTGSPRTIAVDPGAHTLEATAPRHRPTSLQHRATAGERASLRMRLEAITSATLEVVPSVESAVVRVDGARFERGPRPIGAGPHEVVVEARGYQPFRRRITLAPEASLRVDATLTAVNVTRPLVANPLFWAAVGGGTAAVVTAIVLGVTLSGQTPEFVTSTGIVIQGLGR